jgi:hypothetical protein
VGSWPNFKVLSQHSPGGSEKYHENFSQGSQSPGRYFNRGPAEYEAGMLPTRPRHSVNIYNILTL